MWYGCGMHTIKHTFRRVKSVLHRAFRFSKRVFRHLPIKNIILLGLSFGAISIGIFFLWVSTLSLPNIESFNERRVGVSTKIFDRTGKIVLFDLNQNTRRTVVTNEEISDFIKKASIAIEDKNFYNHNGVEPLAFARAIWINILHLRFEQGGSTITQQVVKNALLTTDKKISRKIKEWFLAANLERIMTKDEILNIYLNENPYGSNIYGVEEAAQAFFGTNAKSVSLAEAAYIAALPQAPTYYSPYGKHVEALHNRKNIVLGRMFEQNLITQQEYDQAREEEVTFEPQQYVSIKAPHFVMEVKEYLEETYGTEALASMGLNVVTTIDYDLQQKAEEVVKTHSLKNEKLHNAKNAALVAIDPNTGDILAMVGSRDYFDTSIDGNYNVTTAKRQPGSTFKPIVYAQAFKEGYEPETIVFDLKTEFSTYCNPDGTPKIIGQTTNCYSPVNYDGVYSGPISLRNALAQSKNVPAVKTLYLTGIKDSLRLARDMGLHTIDPNREYGLTLVLGGGEVTLLDLTSAYGVFATEGIRHEYRSVIKITDRNNKVLEEKQITENRVLSEDVAQKITSVLSDNVARTPAFGAASSLYFPGKEVAAKTGTTNDYRDVWTVGYTPSIVIGVWGGNNDNSPIQKKVAGAIIAPMWNEVMKYAIEKYPSKPFNKPIPADTTRLHPMLAGQYLVPVEGAFDAFEVHDILYYIDKNNPLGPRNTNPQTDSQFEYWEYAVQNWFNNYFLKQYEQQEVLPGQTGQ